MDFNLKPLNKKAYVMNAIIAVIAIVSIAMLFLMSFWTLDLSLKIDGNLVDAMGLEESMGSSGEGSTGSSGSSEGSVDPSMAETVNELKKALNDDPVIVSIKLDLTSSMLIGSLISTDSVATVEDFVTAQVGVIMEGLQPAFDSLQTVVVKVGAKAAISGAKKSLFAELSEEDSQKVETALSEVGLTDSYIDETVENLMESLKTNPNIGSVASEITDIVEDVIDKVFEAVDKENSQIADLLGEDLAEYATMSPEDKQNAIDEIKTGIREELPQTLSDSLREIGLVDEEDNVNIESLFTELIASMMEGGNQGNTEPYNAPSYSAAPALGEGESSSSSAPSSGAGSTGSGTTEENKQTLEEMISEMLMQNLATEEVVLSILLVLKSLALILLITAAAWVYLLVKLLVKTLFCKNKTVGLFIPRHIGWIAFVVFVGIPFILNLAIANPDIVNQLLAKLNLGTIESMLGDSAAMLSNLSIACTSGSIGSAIGTILLLFLLLPYRSLRRNFRRSIKNTRYHNK